MSQGNSLYSYVKQINMSILFLLQNQRRGERRVEQVPSGEVCTSGGEGKGVER
jgi:hypothetical protein